MQALYFKNKRSGFVYLKNFIIIYPLFNLVVNKKNSGFELYLIVV